MLLLLSATTQMQLRIWRYCRELFQCWLDQIAEYIETFLDTVPIPRLATLCILQDWHAHLLYCETRCHTAPKCCFLNCAQAILVICRSYHANRKTSKKAIAPACRVYHLALLSCMICREPVGALSCCHKASVFASSDNNSAPTIWPNAGLEPFVAAVLYASGIGVAVGTIWIRSKEAAKL